MRSGSTRVPPQRRPGISALPKMECSHAGRGSSAARYPARHAASDSCKKRPTEVLRGALAAAGGSLNPMAGRPRLTGEMPRSFFYRMTHAVHERTTNTHGYGHKERSIIVGNGN